MILNAITAFIGALVGSAGGGILLSDPKTGEQVAISGKGTSWAHCPNKRLSTSAQTFSEDGDNAGTLLWHNQSQGSKKVSYVSLIPDTNCKTKGIVQILINDVLVFQNLVGYFTDVGSDNVDFAPYGMDVPAGAKVFVKLGSSDGTAVACTVKVVLLQ